MNKRSFVWLFFLIIIVMTYPCSAQQEGKKDSELEKHLRLGTEFLREGYFDLAEYEYKKALVIDPQNGVAIRRLGAVYILQKKYDQAIELYKAYLENYPDAIGIMNNLAVAYMEKGDYEEAERWCKKILKINPEFVPVYLNLADLYIRAGDKEKAISVLKIVEQYTLTENEEDSLEELKKKLKY